MSRICNECRFSRVDEEATDYGIVKCRKDGLAHHFYDPACKKFKQNK